jgi:TolB-like protein/DNA-binding winged helix-turn-helix (wHTH) protein/Flp pilus assembly protein TadD
MAYEFGDFRFDSATGLTSQGQPVALEPQAIHLLAFLIDNRHRIVTKEQLIEEIWLGRPITDAALNTRIRAVRRALKDDRAQQKFIKTFPKRGFQFVADIRPSVGQTVHTPRHHLHEVTKYLVLVMVFLGAILLGRSYGPFAPEPGLTVDDKPSIAVLPFDNLGDGSTAQYFVDGLTDDLIANLSRYQELFVISRSTIFSYRNDEVSPVEIARDLGVAYVARGSVRREGDRIRVTSELIDIAAGETIWAESYDRDLSGVFAVQDEISRSIAARVVPEIIQAGARRLTGRPTENMGAWDLFLRARARQATFTRAAQEDAARLARLAIDRDPEFASAHSLLARALGNLFFYGWSDRPEITLDAATEAAKRAIVLDDRDPQALAALGYIYRFTGNAEPAIANLERAAEINPNDAQIRLELAHTLDWFRQQTRALPQIEQAIRLSPRDPLLQNMYFYKGHILFHLGRFEESLEAARIMGSVVSSPTWQVFHHLLRAANLAELGRLEEARLAIDQALSINPNLSLANMRRQFEGSKNHPENRRAWLAGLKKAGLLD